MGTNRKRSTYFHVAPAGLAVGHEISKGSWGEQTRQFREGGREIANQNEAIIIAWECALEAARQSFKRKAPSRLSCVFACKTEKEARRFRDTYRKDFAIYLVRPVDLAATIYVGDYDLLTGDPSESHVDRIAKRAKHYWTAHPYGLAEVLIDSPVRIVRQVDPPLE